MYATFKRKKIIFYAISVFSAICLIAVAIAFRASRSGEKPSELNAVCVSFLRDKKVKLSDKKPQSIETTLLAHDFSETVKEYNELQNKDLILPNLRERPLQNTHTVSHLKTEQMSLQLFLFTAEK